MVTKTLRNMVGRAIVRECVNAGITHVNDMLDVTGDAMNELTTMAVAGYKAGMARTRNSRRHARRVGRARRR